MIIVHLGRDREGEDTHQNIVHETVLSFGRLGHLIYFTHKKSLIVNNLNLHSLKSYANSNQNSMLASFFSYCFFNSPPPGTRTLNDWTLFPSAHYLTIFFLISNDELENLELNLWRYPFNSHEWPRQNFFLQNQYNRRN